MTTIAQADRSPQITSRPSHVRRPEPTRLVDTRCQLCGASPAETVLDLGPAPLLADLGDADREDADDPHELRLVRCTVCGTVQLDDTIDTGARHRIATAVANRSFAGRPDLARRFCEDAIDRWNLRGDGQIIEVGSGTGSLLRFFRAWQLPVLGIEPDDRLTRYARLRRIPTWRATFDAAIAGRIARAELHADLLIISTPTGGFDDLRELLAASASVLRPGGVLTLELPDVLRLLTRAQLDDCCHANRVLPSITQLRRVVGGFGLELIDVLPSEVDHTQVRLWLRRTRRGVSQIEHTRLCSRLRAEAEAAIDDPRTIAACVHTVEIVRDQIASLVSEARSRHRTVAAFGTGRAAVALANAVGLRRPDIAYVVGDDAVCPDTVLPGTDIPVISATQAGAVRADLLLALDDLPDTLPGWDGVPVYSVSNLIDVIQRLTS